MVARNKWAQDSRRTCTGLFEIRIKMQDKWQPADRRGEGETERQRGRERGKERACTNAPKTMQKRKTQRQKWLKRTCEHLNVRVRRAVCSCPLGKMPQMQRPCKFSSFPFWQNANRRRRRRSSSSGDEGGGEGKADGLTPTLTLTNNEWAKAEGRNHNALAARRCCRRRNEGKGDCIGIGVGWAK